MFRPFVSLAPLPLLMLLACGRPLPPPSVGPRPTAASRPAATQPAHVQRLQMDPIKLQVLPGAGPSKQVEVLEPTTLFEQAGQLLSARRYAEALALYDKLLRHFPTSRLISPTLYNAGLAHEWLKQFQNAANRYRELIRRFGPSKEALDAGFRLGGCYAELRNWPASAQVFSELLKRKDLGASDRIECLARRALAYFRLGDHRAARSSLQEAIAYHRSIETIERLDTDFFLAMVHYYRAAIPHADFRALKVDAGAALARTLDDKARLLLLSQSGYIEAIKVKNPYWATAAGFQIGSLYREFYTVLLTTLPDFTAQAEKNARVAGIPRGKAKEQLVQVYLEEVHRTVKPLLDKAIRVFEKNVLMAERVGVQSEWVQKSRFQVNELKHLLSLPPAQAVKIVTKEGRVPEDQPAEPRKDPPRGSPTLPTGRDRQPDQPPEDADEEPGGVVL